MAGSRYQDPEQARRVSTNEIAKATGFTRNYVTKWLRRNAHWVGAKTQGFPPTYDSRVIDVINAVHGRPSRPLTPAERDWLSAYISGGNTHA